MIEPVGEKATSTIIFAHGSGFSAVRSRDEFTIPLMQAGILCRTRLIIPQARVRFSDFYGDNRTSWFNELVNTQGINGPYAREEILRAADRLYGLIRIAKALYPSEPVGLMGFSIGSALSLTAFLRGPADAAVDGIASLSAYLPMPFEYPQALSPTNRAEKIWLGHAIDDELININFIRTLQTSLSAFGLDTTLLEFTNTTHDLAGKRTEGVVSAVEFLKKEALGAESQQACPLTIGTKVVPVTWKLR